jgi:hypothetical protein
MIEREAAVKVYNETLGAKGAKGRLVRVAEEGYYELLIEASGREFTAYLPLASTVLVAAEAEESVASLEVER